MGLSFVATAAAVALAALVADRLPTRRLASKVLARARTLPLKYPRSLDTSLVTVGGDLLPATVRVYQDAVYVYDAEGTLLVPLKLDDLAALAHKNLTRQGTVMAGFALVTRDGQYQFFSAGPLAEANVEEMVGWITTTVERETGRRLAILGRDEILHRAAQS